VGGAYDFVLSLSYARVSTDLERVSKACDIPSKSPIEEPACPSVPFTSTESLRIYDIPIGRD